MDLSSPQVMGILNLTADSFSDGGELVSGGRLDRSALLARADAMVSAGAAWLDLGAESTRPGARSVSEALQVDLLGEALSTLRRRLDVRLSVDSSAPAVFRVAAELGADMLNDVRALQAPGALEAAAATGLPVCLVHMQGEPGTMQQAPRYDNVVLDVRDFLRARIAACAEAGIPRRRIVLDPGFGFGKLLPHNLALLNELGLLVELECPVLVGMSRKRMLGEVTGRELEARVPAGVAAAVLAMERGAAIVRTHDVGPTMDAVAMVCALREHGSREA